MTGNNEKQVLTMNGTINKKKKKRERKKWTEQVGFHKKGSSVVHAVLGQVSITSR